MAGHKGGSMTSCKQMTFGVLFAAYLASAPSILSTGSACASTAAENPSTGQSGRIHSAVRYKSHSDYSGQANYFGNWGFAPGGYYWDPNYLWRRSRGFWDTNSPACPFRSC
jgi:hypothetical protein